MKYAAAFVAVIVAANLATAQWGVVSFLGLTATAGTAVAGFGFVARDALQDDKGGRWVLAAIVAGASITAAFSPALALASATAFIVSEAADWGVYTPLRKRHRLGAALASNSVGALLDSVVFLAVARVPDRRRTRTNRRQDRHHLGVRTGSSLCSTSPTPARREWSPP